MRSARGGAGGFVRERHPEQAFDAEPGEDGLLKSAGTATGKTLLHRIQGERDRIVLRKAH